MSPQSSTTGDWHQGTASQEVPKTDRSGADDGSDKLTLGEELPLDVTFELLKNYRRRLALRYLDDHPSTTLSTLAEHVAGRENDKPVSALTSAERKRVYISLYQCHLPKLDDAGVIDFDSDRGTVERAPLADHFEPYLQHVVGGSGGDQGVLWHRYYLGIAIAGGLLLAAQTAVIPTFLGTTTVALALVVSFVGVALVHARRRA